MELIFEKKDAARQEKLNEWLITEQVSPVDLRQPKSKHKSTDDTTRHNHMKDFTSNAGGMGDYGS